MHQSLVVVYFYYRYYEIECQNNCFDITLYYYIHLYHIVCQEKEACDRRRACFVINKFV